MIHHLFELGSSDVVTDCSRMAGDVGTTPQARQPPRARSDLMPAGYMAMVSPYWNASKFTISTPASIRMLHSVLPQQCTPARALSA